MSSGFIITRQGLNVLAKALTGAELKFTRAALGDCNYDGGDDLTPVIDEQAFERTELIQWKKDLPIVENPTIEAGVAYVKFLIANADVTDGFWMCETGLFVEDPDNPLNEILYAYEFRGLEGGWLPPTGGQEVWEHLLIAAIAIGQAENVTAVIDASGASYTLPVAGASTLGGVKVGYGLSMAGDVLNVTLEGGGASYTLPVAGASTLGGVKVGYGLSVAADGTLSRAAGGVLDTIPSTVEGAMWYIPVGN